MTPDVINKTCNPVVKEITFQQDTALCVEKVLVQNLLQQAE